MEGHIHLSSKLEMKLQTAANLREFKRGLVTFDF